MTEWMNEKPTKCMQASGTRNGQKLTAAAATLVTYLWSYLSLTDWKIFCRQHNNISTILLIYVSVKLESGLQVGKAKKRVSVFGVVRNWRSDGGRGCQRKQNPLQKRRKCCRVFCRCCCCQKSSLSHWLKTRNGKWQREREIEALKLSGISR